MQRASAGGTDLLLFWKPVFHRLHGQVKKHGLATIPLFMILIGDSFDRRFSQKWLSFRPGFVEEPQLLAIRLLAGNAETAFWAQGKLLFVLPEFPLGDHHRARGLISGAT